MDGWTKNLPILQDFVAYWAAVQKEREKEKYIGEKGKPVAKRHHMVSGTLAPLYTVFGLKLGCSGAVAPIGRFSVRPSVPLSRAQKPARQALDPASQASEPASQPSLRGRCPATAQLQPKNCIKRGKGTI